MRIFIGMLMTALFVGSTGACKTREPEQAGLLSAADEAVDDAVASGGEYSVRCSAEDEAPANIYMLVVRGAVSATDEAQLLIVDVDQLNVGASQPKRLFSSMSGRGAIDMQKSLFIGFERGALTADAADDTAGGFTGVLSIADQVDGLAVRCQVAHLTLDPK